MDDRAWRTVFRAGVRYGRTTVDMPLLDLERWLDDYCAPDEPVTGMPTRIRLAFDGIGNWFPAEETPSLPAMSYVRADLYDAVVRLIEDPSYARGFGSIAAYQQALLRVIHAGEAV
jgi:hypothetical protein